VSEASGAQGSWHGHGLCVVGIPPRVERMSNRAHHRHEQPNIAGLSLALYVLVSLLSMMAFYEGGKTNEDVRNSIVHSLQSGQQSPSKSGGDDTDAFHLPKAPRVSLVALADKAPASVDHRLPTFHVTASFDARGPPFHA